jgi:hypothetical protein
MNRRKFFNALAALAGAISLSPNIFVPKFEPVHWKVLTPQQKDEGFLLLYPWKGTAHLHGDKDNSTFFLAVRNQVHLAHYSVGPSFDQIQETGPYGLPLKLIESMAHWSPGFGSFSGDRARPVMRPL